MAVLGNTRVTRGFADNAAVAADELVRKGELDAALSGVQGAHTHAASQITDFQAAWRTQFPLYIIDGDNVEWFVDGAYRKARVRMKVGGGLKSTSDGLEVDFGGSGTQVAAGNHTHAQLHDALTKSNGVTVSLSLTDQLLTAEVIRATNSGLKVDSGLAVDFGSGTNQVARGDHSHSGLDHPPVTVLPSSTLTLTENGNQQVSGGVKLSMSPGANRAALGVDSSGLYIPLGVSGTEAAAGDHTHANASNDAAGFLSAEDKRKLDLYAVLLHVDQSVLFTRHDVLPAGEYVGGRHRWGQSMQIVAANVVARAGTGQVTLGLHVDGSIVESIDVPAGSVNTEVFAYKAFPALYIEADKYARWICLSGVGGGIENEASKLDLAMIVRPALDTAPTIRINCGGGAVTPYSSDQFYDSGSTINLPGEIDVTGVTNPAPESVYFTCRSRVSAQGFPLTYTIVGLARGINYQVRLHFSDNSGTLNEGDQVFHIVVTGLDLVWQWSNFDILDVAGSYEKAVVREVTMMADANGRIIVQLIPVSNTTGSYRCQISGIECIPQV